MANQAAWNQGWAIGARGYGGTLGRRQQLNEEEFKAKATELGQQLGMLRQKLGQHPEGSEEHCRIVNEMQSRISEIRELYHPNRHPSAIRRFAHLLTDALHLTSGKKRIAQAGAKRAAASAEDEREASEMAEAGPEYKAPEPPPELDPEEIHLAARVKAGLDPRATAPKPLAWKPVGKPIRVGDKVWQQQSSPYGDLRMVPESEGIEAPEEVWKPRGNIVGWQGKAWQPEINSAGQMRLMEAPRGVKPPPGKPERWTPKGKPVLIQGKWMQLEASASGKMRYTPFPEGAPIQPPKPNTGKNWQPNK
jgi:hypothetical protein